MKIKFVSGPKQGAIEHLQPSIANTLIASGLAELVPYKGFRERLAEESNMNRSHVRAGAVAPEFFTTPVWSAKQLIHSGKVVVEKRFGTETVAYSTPPADCPPAVVRAFESLTTKPDTLAADQLAREAAVRAQAEYVERSKTFKRW